MLFVIKNLQFLDLMQTMLLGDRVDEAEYIELPTEPKQRMSCRLWWKIRHLIFWRDSLQNRRIPLSSRRDSPRSLRMTIPLPHCWLKCRLLLRMWLRQNRKM